ncbi:MAG: ABC transporter permease [Myxococcales bacterium]
MTAPVSLLVVEAARALSRNKLRSVLTAIAIMIGIAAVVCVVAIGRAGSKRAEEQLENLGENFVWIEAGGRAPSGVRTGPHGTTRLTLADAQAVAREPLIKRMSPNVDGRAQVVYGNRNWNTRWRGIDIQWFDIKRWDVSAGAHFLEQDVVSARSVALIGATVREQLFPGEDPIGKVIRVNEQLFQVVGVLAARGSTNWGSDQDDTLVIPWTAAQMKLRGRTAAWLDDILCSAISPQAVNAAIDDVTLLLRQRHHIQPGQEDDFNIRRPDEIIQAQIETSRTLAVLLISIASISLVVGGIGVMNVMLVAVTERTREIGLRLAVGATEGAIQRQFLGEAVMLSVFGGMMGVLLSVGGAFLIENLLGWKLGLPLQAAALAVVFSVGVGVVFGFYPAWRAARLDPITALRNE